MKGIRDFSRRSRDEGPQSGRALLIVIAGALCLGAAFLAAAIVLASCSASVSSTIRADGGASVSIQADVPAPLAAKFRKLSGTGAFFDVSAIRKSIAARPALSLVELGQPGPDSIRAEISARSIEELASSSDLKDSGLIALSRGPGWVEFRFRIDKGSAKALAALFPGLDPYLLEALSPPALEDDPVTIGEYTSMLRSVLGDKTMPAMEAATITVSIGAPGTIVGSGGGSLSGSTLTARLPIIQILALEKPIELWLRWKQVE